MQVRPWMESAPRIGVERSSDTEEAETLLEPQQGRANAGNHSGQDITLIFDFQSSQSQNIRYIISQRKEKRKASIKRLVIGVSQVQTFAIKARLTNLSRNRPLSTHSRRRGGQSWKWLS